VGGSLLGGNRSETAGVQSIGEDHPKELFGGRYRTFQGARGGDKEEGHALIGPRPGLINRTATSADSLVKGEHHVRTLYGEGTARDFLCAV
jgi:hypothetical protein